MIQPRSPRRQGTWARQQDGGRGGGRGGEFVRVVVKTALERRPEQEKRERVRPREKDEIARRPEKAMRRVGLIRAWGFLIDEFVGRDER